MRSASNRTVNSTQPLQLQDGWAEGTARALFSPIDISFLVAFRIVVAVSVLWTVHGFLHSDLAASLATRPFRFTYHGFAWVRPWPTTGMYAHFGVLALLAFLLCLGWL